MAAFVKPSVITLQTGAYSYKEGISSTSTNYIDNSFPNILNKTGDTITGEIDVATTGSIKLLGSSQIHLTNTSSILGDAGTLITIDGYQVIGAGGKQTFQAGSSSIRNSGSTEEFQSGSIVTYDVGATAIVNGQYIFNAGSLLVTQGQSVIISDGTNPTFLTPRTQTIAQPLFVFSTSTWTASSGYNFEDAVGGGNQYVCPITKIINGATIASFVVGFFTSTSAPTSADATVTLWRTDNSVTPATALSLGTYTVPTGLSGLSGYRQTVTVSTNNIIDVSKYSYFIRIIASSTQPIVWQPPILNLTQILTLGNV